MLCCREFLQKSEKHVSTAKVLVCRSVCTSWSCEHSGMELADTGLKKRHSLDQSMWDLWWTVWHWDRFSLSTSVSFPHFHSTFYLCHTVEQDKRAKPGTPQTKQRSFGYRGRCIGLYFYNVSGIGGFIPDAVLSLILTHVS
jgi:hypothetical protein